MNFNFRSMENRSSTYSFSSPIYLSSNNYTPSYFTHEAIRAGLTGAESSRRDYSRNPNPNDIRESFHRELEKERIRAEIIAEEVYRRRILEEEVRRELMLEREFAARRRGERELRIGSSSSMQFGTRVPLLTNFEHRIGVSQTPSREAQSETVPFQRDPVVAGDNGNVFSLGVRLKEIKELKGSVSEINKEKAIILAKPDEIDLKRKATGPPTGATADPSNVSKKQKNQEEWSCALCRITATSEQALNDHLRGKRHKSRENGLNSQRVGFCTGPLPKTGSASTGKPIKVPGAANEPGSKKQDKKTSGETLLGEVGKSTAQNLPGIDNKISLLQGKETSVITENKESVITANKEPQKSPASAKPNKKFKFMCDICKVGAYSLKVLNSHKKGKRHLAKVSRLNKSDQHTSGELCALKKDVANELIPDTEATVDKSVVEENKNLSKAAVKETIIETPAQKGTDKEADIAVYVDNGNAEENMELHITAAKGTSNKTEEEDLESNQEIADEDKGKVFEVVGEFANK